MRSRKIIIYIKFISAVHPCDQASKGGCDDTCTKNGDLAVCSCTKTGYKLHTDEKTCGKDVGCEI